MTTVPLDRYPLFRSRELDQAREVVGKIFTPHRLDLTGRSRDLNARMNTRRVNRVAANFITYGGDVLIEPGELGSFFVVQLPLSGHSTIFFGGEEILSTPDMATVVSPTEHLTMRWSADCSMLILRVERSALEAHLSELLGIPLLQPVRFTLGMDVSTGYGRSWASTFRLLVQELDRTDDSMINNDLAASELEDGLMTALLVAQPHNYSAVLDRSEDSPVPSRAVTLVRELIETHPEWSHTVGTLAREANVSVRALQKAFATYLGMSPIAYLTKVRMQRARDELRAAQYETITVGHVAAKWGLGHPGRFASSYRRRFGELPSETLRR